MRGASTRRIEDAHDPHLWTNRISQDEDSSYVELPQRDNKEEVIKNLLQLYASVDEGKTGSIPCDMMVRQLLTEWDITIQAGGLEESEKRGRITHTVSRHGSHVNVGYLKINSTCRAVSTEVETPTR